MAGQGIIVKSELHDEVTVGSRVLTASTADQILFVTDRDCWLNDVWVLSHTAESDNETYTINKVPAGTQVGQSGEVAVTTPEEMYPADNPNFVLDTRCDLTVDTANNYLPAGTTVYITASTAFQTSSEIVVGWRTTTRRQ